MLRVLYDVFYASLPGYSGIPHDTRLLAKTLAHVDGCHTSLLVHPRERSERLDAALARSPELALALVLNGGIDLKRTRSQLAKLKARFRRRIDSYRGSRMFPVASVTNPDFLDAVWRVFFDRSLPASDREFLRRCGICVSAASEGDLTGLRPERLAPTLDTSGFDIAVFQQTMAVTASPGTRLVMRYHDPIPLIAPDTTLCGEGSARNHYDLARRALINSVLVCNSAVTQEQLVRLMPEAGERSVVIPYLCPRLEARPDGPDLADVIRRRLTFEALAAPPPDAASRRARLAAEAGPDRAFDYVLMVSTLEPRKNHHGALAAVARVRRRTGRDLRFVVVGRPGGRGEGVLAAMAPGLEDGHVIHLVDVDQDELAALYRSASACLFPSFAEGFGLPPIEAIGCGTPTVVSDIPVHRWVMEDAVLYADPYDIGAIADQLQRLVHDPGAADLRSDLAGRAERVLARFSLEATTAAWATLFERLAATPASAAAAVMG